MERKEILTVVMIGVLLLTVAIQTVQLVTLSNQEVVVSSTSASRTPVKTGSQNGMAAGSGGSLDSLPSMVGGC